MNKEEEIEPISKSRKWVEVAQRILDGVGWLILIGFAVLWLWLRKQQNQVPTLAECNAYYQCIPKLGIGGLG